MNPPAPLLLRDFSQGRYAPSSVDNFLIPLNSVSFARNVYFDTTIGAAVVRPGTTKIGSTVASGKTPLGLTNFVTSGGSSNLLISVFSGASNASIYYYDSSWHTSGVTNISNTAKNRFAQLGNRIFAANGTDAMQSSADGNTWNTTDCIATDSVIPSLLFSTKSRMIASGYSGFRDRVYFSSIIDPNASTFLTWNTDPNTGDWLDINPDDGSNITGFSQASNFVLVFKSNAMYRLDAIAKTVDLQNIFNIGAVSQEGITLCQGVTYFFTGIDIRSTDGSYPVQISRTGVQDFINAIPQANWSSVAAGTDGLSVWFSLGSITLNAGKNNATTYSNVVLKFSPRDDTWTILTYAQLPRFFSQYTNSTNGTKMIFSDTSGNVQTADVGLTDNTTPIAYEVITQDQELGNKAHFKEMSDDIAVFLDGGPSDSLQVSADGGDFLDCQIKLTNGVSIGTLNTQGNVFRFRWSGESSGTAPEFHGLYVEKIQDKGFVNR